MTIFNTLNELNGKSGGLLGLGIMIAAGLLIWWVVLAVRQVPRLEDWVCKKREIARERIQLSHMNNEELAQAAIKGNVRLAYGALERLDDTALLMEVAQKARSSIAKRAAAKHCELAGHDWNGCKCRICGKQRNEEHDWGGCICRICGLRRNEEHDWDGCICRICGERRNEEHDWDGCICKKCGERRNEEHDWGDSYVCSRCNAVKPHEHVWKYACTEIDESCSCGSCNKPKAGGVEDWCGDFCFGPSACAIVTQREMERCELCGELREKK